MCVSVARRYGPATSHRAADGDIAGAGLSFVATPQVCQTWLTAPASKSGGPAYRQRCRKLARRQAPLLVASPILRRRWLSRRRCVTTSVLWPERTYGSQECRLRPCRSGADLPASHGHPAPSPALRVGHGSRCQLNMRDRRDAGPCLFEGLRLPALVGIAMVRYPLPTV